MAVLGFTPPARMFTRRPAVERGQAAGRAPGGGRGAGPVRPGQARPFPHGSGAYTVKTWRPPMPEPLQPAPLLGPLTLAGIGAAAFLSQLWGWLARRDRRGEQQGSLPLPGPAEFTGSYSRTGQTILTIGPHTYAKRVVNPVTGQCVESNAGNLPGGGTAVIDGLLSVEYVFGAPSSPCGGYSSIGLRAIDKNGNPVAIGGTSGGGGGWYEFQGSINFQTSAPDAIPATNGASQLSPLPGLQLPPGLFVPAPTPLPLPLPKTDPLPQPLPEVQPLTQPAPSLPLAVPGAGTLPRLPAYPSTGRPAVPTLPGQQVQDGALVPQRPAAPVRTPADAIIPWPGAEPVGGPGQSPQPTLTGIAQEVGRIERKVDQIMRPRLLSPANDPVGWLDMIDDLWELLSKFSPGGSYELRGVCERDANGEPIETVVEHEWPPGVGEFAGVFGRLDAIAAMLQTHKELRQPICRHPKPQGEFVTVQFEEM